MTKVNNSNELIKRDFFRWLREANGCCQATVNSIEKAILLYEDFTNHIDFKSYNPDKAIAFKKWLRKREFRSKRISIVTYHSYLRYLRKFFTWLSSQPHHKSKITSNSVDYLKISEKEQRIATQCVHRKYPPLDYVVKLTSSIQITTEIDLRDRALISFTLLSGMRDKAIVSLPFGCLDINNLTVNQDPRLGTQTKFSKHIVSTLLVFDERLLRYLKKWVERLNKKGYKNSFPLFPQAKTERNKDGLSFVSSSGIEPKYWQGADRIRTIFKRRSEAVNLPYYPPHSFRHLAVDLALKHCKTGEEIKAVSQNFGHEYVATTLSSYANFDKNRLSDILRNINFKQDIEHLDNDKIERIKKILSE